MAEALLSMVWHNHNATFTHMLSTLRNKERYTDATIACGGKFYSVHKLVLSTCSDYFLKMFEKTPCSKHPIVVLGDIQCRDIEALLSYMYEGVVNVAQSDLAQLIKVAELLQIKGLAVPDEPPMKKRGQTATQSPVEDLTSPHPKRQKKDHNNGQSHSDNRHELPSNQTSSPRQPVRQSLPQDSFHSKEPDRGGEERLGVGGGRGGEERLGGGGRGGEERLGGRGGKDLSGDDNKAGDRLDVPGLPPREEKERSDTLHKNQSADVQKSFPMAESKEIIDENLIKEEVVESSSEGDGLDYGGLGDVGGDSGGSVEDPGGLYLASMFNNIEGQTFNSQAGPSGLQGWSMPGDAEDMTSQAYMNQELSTQPGSIPGVMQGQHRSLQDQPHHLMKLNSGVEGFGMRTNAMENGKRKHTCPYCDYTTNDSTSIKRHMRKHTGEKPFVCMYCPARMTRKASLLSHIQSHSGENPYSCEYCPYVSRQKSNLKRHLKTHHEEELNAALSNSFENSEKDKPFDWGNLSSHC